MFSLRSILREFDTRSSAKDGRDGHGYGRIGKPRGTGTTWVMGRDYPYVMAGEDCEDCEEFEDDEDINTDRLMRKLSSTYYVPHDPMGQRSGRVDRSSFASSSARGLGEAVGMVPKPGLYRQKDTSVGGMSPTVYKTGRVRKIGMKTGWSMRPPEYEDAPAQSADKHVFHPSDLESDDERALSRAKATHDKLVSEFRNLFGGMIG